MSDAAQRVRPPRASAPDASSEPDHRLTDPLGAAPRATPPRRRRSCRVAGSRRHRGRSVVVGERKTDPSPRSSPAVRSWRRTGRRRALDRRRLDGESTRLEGRMEPTHPATVSSTPYCSRSPALGDRPAEHQLRQLVGSSATRHDTVTEAAVWPTAIAFPTSMSVEPATALFDDRECVSAICDGAVRDDHGAGRGRPRAKSRLWRQGSRVARSNWPAERPSRWDRRARSPGRIGHRFRTDLHDASSAARAPSVPGDQVNSWLRRSSPPRS
jgi:hypothetical protein